MDFAAAAAFFALTKAGRDTYHHIRGTAHGGGTHLSNVIEESAKEATKFEQWSRADDFVTDKFLRGPTDEWRITFRDLTVPAQLVTSNMPEDTIP